MTGEMNTLSLLLIVSQPIKSIRTFCIKHAEFIHSAFKQLSKVFSPTDAVFPFQGEGTLFFGACSPNFKNSTTSEARAHSAAQIIPSNHNSASISKGTLVSSSEPRSPNANAHVRRRPTQKEQRQRPICEWLGGFQSETGQKHDDKDSWLIRGSAASRKPNQQGLRRTRRNSFQLL